MTHYNNMNLSQSMVDFRKITNDFLVSIGQDPLPEPSQDGPEISEFDFALIGTYSNAFIKDVINELQGELENRPYECQKCEGRNTRLDMDCDEQWCLDCDDFCDVGPDFGEESREDIARTENKIIDDMEGFA